MESDQYSMLPGLGDSLLVTSIQAPDDNGEYTFHGFSGFGNLRMLLMAEDGVVIKIPISEIVKTVDTSGISVSNGQYMEYARDGFLPSNSIFLLENAHGQEHVHADHVAEIKSRVRHNRVIKGMLIGMVLTVPTVLWIRHLCDGVCDIPMN